MSDVLPRADAQESTGSIAGTVADSTGAAVQGATVTVTNTGTGSHKQVTSGDAGGYLLVSLTPGTYQIDIEASGFKHYRRLPVDVQVATTSRLDVALQLGQVAETVTVTSEAALISTETSSVGQVIEGRTVQDTPLNGRNVMNLLALDPGVIPQGSTAGGAQGNQNGGGHTNPQGYGNYQIGGGLPGQSAQFLDGAPLNALGLNEVALIPTQDFVQEFKTETNNVSAQFGRYSGGVVTMTTKSGENQYHGTLYEFIRNTVFDANDFFSNLNHQARPLLHQNQYGAAAGGPIKRDKLFFYGSFDRYTYSSGYPYSTHVPTAAQRSGDFSASLGPAIGTNPCDGSPIYQGQLFDPTSTRTVNGVVCRTAIPGNKIPAARYDPTSNYILNTAQYFPLPNATGTYNYFSTTPIGGNQYQIGGRGDYLINDKQRLFTRYSYWHVSDLTQNVFSNLTGNPPADIRTNQAVVGHTWTIAPTAVLETRLSYTRFYNDSRPISLGTDLSGFGPAWTSLASQVPFPALPSVIIGPSGSASSYDPLMTHIDGTQFSYANSYVISANLTKSFAKHTIVAGVDVRRLEQNATPNLGGEGSYNFLGGWTSIDSGKNATSPAKGSTGDMLADFELGTANSGSVTTGRMPAAMQYYQAYYVTDTYHALPQLSLNYGLRWELPGAYKERHDSLTVLLPGATDPLGTAVNMNLTGQVVLVNSSAYPNRTIMVVSDDLVAPRIGFSYNLKHGTVVHGGYGISYLPSDSFGNQGPISSVTNFATTTMVTTIDGGLTPYNRFYAPFPANGVPGNTSQYINPALGRGTNLTALEGQSVTAPYPFHSFPYTQQWNLLTEQQLGSSASLSVGYIAAHGAHLPSNTPFNYNQLPDGYLSQGSALGVRTANPFQGKVSSLGSLNGATVVAGQLLLPHPQFSKMIDNTPLLGASSYNSLQAKFQERFHYGGSLLVSYLYAKLLSNVDSQFSNLNSGTEGTWQDFTNLRSEWSVSSSNVPQRFVASYVLDLPVGKGRALLGNAPRVLDEIVGGWTVNGIVTLQAGFPLAFTANQGLTTLPSLGFGVIRPNRAGGCSFAASGSASQKVLAGKWFNATCVTQPADFTLGNVAREESSISGPGIANWDFATAKRFILYRETSFEFRAEFFNMFNRVQFAMPATQVGSSGIGSISSQLNTPRLVQFAGRIRF